MQNAAYVGISTSLKRRTFAETPLILVEKTFLFEEILFREELVRFFAAIRSFVKTQLVLVTSVEETPQFENSWVEKLWVEKL